jgi:hypothetical protein
MSCLLFLGACGGGGGDNQVAPAPPPPSGTIEREVEPQAADPRVTTSLQPHVAITPSTQTRANRLFVFLPGTGGTPAMYRLILRSGAARGYHGLGINYPNADAVGSLCFGREAACFWDVRREVITGVNHSALVSVDEPDAIVTRLERALSYLHANHPDEGWDQYLENGSIVWSKAVVAGHSQGGGHAGVMAKLFAMSRAVYFSSPADWNALTSEPAQWMAGQPNVTAAAQQYGFGNVGDTLVPYGELRVNWSALGLTAFGQPVAIDGATTASFASSHLLVTAVAGNSGGSVSPPHGSTVLDAATPLDPDGTPTFDAAWAYLCFP